MLWEVPKEVVSNVWENTKFPWVPKPGTSKANEKGCCIWELLELTVLKPGRGSTAHHATEVMKFIMTVAICMYRKAAAVRRVWLLCKQIKVGKRATATSVKTNSKG